VSNQSNKQIATDTNVAAAKEAAKPVATVVHDPNTRYPGRLKFDAKTREWVSIEEWNRRYYVPKPKVPMAIVKNFQPYISMTSGKVITNERARMNDMHAAGARPYEGRHIEQQEADRHKQYAEEKFEHNVEETLNQTMHDIEHGHLVPRETEDPTKPVQTMDFSDAEG